MSWGHAIGRLKSQWERQFPSVPFEWVDGLINCLRRCVRYAAAYLLAVPRVVTPTSGVKIAHHIEHTMISSFSGYRS